MDMAVKSVEPDFDGPWELPEGWAWALLSETLGRVITTDPKRDLGLSPFHYIDLGAIEDGKIVKPQSLIGSQAPSRARQIVKPGDTIFSCVRVYLKNTALVGEGLMTPVASTAFCVLRPSDAIDAHYLNYFVRSQRFIEWMIPLQRGNSPPAVVDSDVKAQPIPLAPLAEQRRIVRQVDALFAEIAEGEAALNRAREGLDTFRRALLKAAVTGELTKDWRERNPVTETGHDRLARLRGSLAKSKRRRTVWTPRADVPRLPESWAWCAVDEAGDVQLGRQRAPQHHEGADMRPYLRVANVLEDRLDLSDVKLMNFTPEEFKVFALKTGDILLNEGQAPDLLGRPAMYRGEIEGCCFQKTLLRFRASELVDQNFALLVFRHYMHSGRFKRESRITTNIGHLTQVRFVEMEFPIPPPAEAAEILRRVSEALSASADTLAMLDAEAADAARLKQSILKAAYEGRLVPQDAADEPASAMLARLKATSATARPARLGRRAKS